MEKYRYIIIDDEYPSHLSVRHHLIPYQDYKCVSTFYDPEIALVYLNEHNIDLIFLDIAMPQMNGFQFLERLNKKIFVVFLTAFSDKYAEQSHKYFFDNEIVFFCNKSQFSYFLPKIITHFEKLYNEKEKINRINKLFLNEIHVFPKLINKKPLSLSEILFVTVIGHNIVLRLKNKREVVIRMTLKELKNILPNHIFIQISRNIIISIMHITAFTDTTVCVADEHFIISKLKRKQVIIFLKTHIEALYNVYHKTS